MVLPKLIQHHEKTGLRGALIHVLGSKTGAPEKPSHHHPYYSAWSRSFNFTYGLGVTEQFKDQVDVLTAIRPNDARLEASEDGLDIQDVNRKAPGDAQDEGDEAAKQMEEAEDEVLREFEYVPIQLMYQHLAHHDGTGKQYGSWPFKKDLPKAK